MTAEKISLAGEKATLLVPLWSKALESLRPDPIIRDPRAREILERIDYDFGALAVPQKTAAMLCMRAARLDAAASEFLAARPRGVVLHLGCGLDSRCERVARGEAPWYDVDYPEVIELRRRFYEESSGYRMVASSVTDPGWLEHVTETGVPALVVAEGLFMYLSPDEIRNLLRELCLRFDPCEAAFDAYSKLTARRASAHPSLRATGATVRWGLDDPAELEAWNIGARVLEEWAFADSEALSKLDPLSRAMFRVSGWFKAARRAHRIVRIRLERGPADARETNGPR